MTGSSNTLTDEQLAEVKVYTGAAAWAAHQALPLGEQVDLPTAYRIRGQLKLVAADLLETVCLKASQTASQSSGGLKRVKLDGELEIERFAKTSAEGVSASAWCAQAERLRREVQLSGLGGPLRSPLAGAISGSTGPPVFRVSKRRGEP